MSHDTSATQSMHAYLWLQVCEILKWHNQGSDKCIDTVNRLWRKHPDVVAPNGEVLLSVPVLTADMFTVKTELWSLERLTALKRGHARQVPQFFPPIVLLHWFGRYFVIDGNTRINFWQQHDNAGPHGVLTIYERAK